MGKHASSGIQGEAGWIRAGEGRCPGYSLAGRGWPGELLWELLKALLRLCCKLLYKDNPATESAIC